VDDLWNPEEANELLRAVLVEIEALAEQLSAAALRHYSKSSRKTSGTPF
jgi:hypothetical protein